MKETQLTPKKAYNDQLRHAADRQIEFDITYTDWLEMWLVSGKWFERGKKSSQYVMCRYGDTGPYSIKNCYIGTVEQNGRDRWSDVEKIDDTKAKHIYDMYCHTDMTQKEVAEYYGINQSYVSRIVNKLRKKNAR